MAKINMENIGICYDLDCERPKFYIAKRKKLGNGIVEVKESRELSQREIYSFMLKAGKVLCESNDNEFYISDGNYRIDLKITKLKDNNL